VVWPLEEKRQIVFSENYIRVSCIIFTYTNWILFPLAYITRKFNHLLWTILSSSKGIDCPLLDYHVNHDNIDYPNYHVHLRASTIWRLSCQPGKAKYRLSADYHVHSRASTIWRLSCQPSKARYRPSANYHVHSKASTIWRLSCQPSKARYRLSANYHVHSKASTIRIIMSAVQGIDYPETILSTFGRINCSRKTLSLTSSITKDQTDSFQHSRELWLSSLHPASLPQQACNPFKGQQMANLGYLSIQGSTDG
jgi:hypothetical protein